MFLMEKIHLHSIFFLFLDFEKINEMNMTYTHRKISFIFLKFIIIGEIERIFSGFDIRINEREWKRIRGGM